MESVNIFSVKQKAEMLGVIRELLTPEARWTKYKLAKDADGYGTGPVEDDAVCWCLEGAIVYANGGLDSAFDEIEKALIPFLPVEHISIVAFNDADETFHGNVIELLDTAISYLETQLP